MNWHLWKRRYDLIADGKHISHIDGGFLAWDFHFVDNDGKDFAVVNRDFTSIPREVIEIMPTTNDDL